MAEEKEEVEEEALVEQRAVCFCVWLHSGPYRPKLRPFSHLY